MGNPEKCRAVRAMATRWTADLARLEKLFGEYTEPERYHPDAEMQRNLGTALEHARAFLSSSHCQGRPVHGKG